MTLNWQLNDYFSLLLHRDKRAHTALEMLVDDLHAEKERSISKFLCHSGSEDFLWGLVRLLGNSNSRVAGNSAYIIGTLAESELGCYRVISLTSGNNPEGARILPDLTNMLTFDDSESVMNAAGTMGTLAESHDGRMWMLTESCLPQTLSHITALLGNDNLWTASNAALVLARLTIAEEGCERLLAHRDAEHILTKLIISLGVDEAGHAGRGMNAAFAIGRLCDMEWGRNKLLSLPDSEKMISSLAKMLCCSDTGASKNACFALSCLATNKDGHTRLLKNSNSDEVLKTLSELLSAEDAETGWFAAMTLRTLASQPKGCLRLRDHQSIIPALKAIQGRSDVGQDLLDEVLQTLEILKKLEKAPTPTAEVLGPHHVKVSWPAVPTKSGFGVRYHLFEEGRCVYQGKDTTYTMQGLRPHSHYTFRVRALTDGDEGPLSDSVTVTTEESAPIPEVIPESPVPGPVSNLRVMGATTTQLKVAWDPPDDINGVLKGYVITAGKLTEHTNDTSFILTGLTQNTTYEVQVCAHTSKGKGPKESVIGTTSELGAHAPSKPEVIVRGRNELHVSWKPPEVPLGRISRYDLLMDGEAVYSGTELHYTVHRLQPNTEYSFQVVAITSEGKCESKTTKRRTAKDGFEGDRAPLYQPPVKKDSDADSPPKPNQLQKKRKSVSSVPATTSHDNHPAPKSASTRATSASSSKSRRREKTPVDNQSEAVVVRRGSTIHKDTDTVSRRKDAGPKQDSESETVRPQSFSAKSRASRTSDISDLSLGRSSTTVTREVLPKPKKYDGLPKSKHTVRGNLRPTKSLELSNGVEPISKRLNRKKSVDVEEPVSTLPEKKTVGRAIANVSKDLLEQVQSKNKLSHNASGLMRDLPSDSEQTLDRRRSASESENKWLNQTRRPEQAQDLAHTFTSLQLSSYRDQTFKPTSSQTTMRSGYIELDAALPLPNKSAQQLPPAQIQRTNTMISSHRPGMKRNLDKLSTRGLSNSQQWKPEFPSSPQVERSHNKFVPMQLRTQPANLPTSMQRQVSNLAMLERGQSSIRLDFLPKQSTEIDLRNPVYMYGPAYKEEEDLTRLSLNNGQSLSKERLMSGRSSITTTSEPSQSAGPLPGTSMLTSQRQRTGRTTTMASSLALAQPPANETKMQSAR